MSRSASLNVIHRVVLLAMLAISALSLSACLDDLASTGDTPLEEWPDTPGWYSVYFTDPGGPHAQSLRGGPDAELAEAIDQARLSVDTAIYDLDLWSIRDALIEAHRRGVNVRVVTESDNMDSPEVQELQEAGVPVLGDRRQGLMHNKFVVIDRLDVWTGSMNFTINGAYRNDNNLIRIQSSRLAKDYMAEFEEMFVDDQFGSGSPANTPHPSFSLDGSLLEVYFSPDDGSAARLIELIAGAQESVYFMAYAFTADDIAQALVERTQAGITVAGVIDQGQANNQGSEYESLLAEGLDVRLDGSSGRMHHKVIIIDGQTVVTGSYNFSASAESRNDENTLVIHNPRIVDQYLNEFERVFDQAR